MKKSVLKTFLLSLCTCIILLGTPVSASSYNSTYSIIPNTTSNIIENNILTTYYKTEILDKNELFNRALNNINDINVLQPKEIIFDINETKTITPILSTTQLLKKEINSFGDEKSSFVTTYICDFVENTLPNGTIQLLAVNLLTKQSNNYGESSDLRLYTRVSWEEGTINKIPYVMMKSSEGWYEQMDTSCNPSNFKIRGRYTGVKLNNNGSTGAFLQYNTAWMNSNSNSTIVNIPSQKLEASTYWWMYADAEITLSRHSQTWTLNWSTVSSNII